MQFGVVGGAEVLLVAESEAAGTAAERAFALRAPIAKLEEIYESALRRALGE